VFDEERRILMDTLEAIRTRYACRDFGPQPVTEEELRTISQAAIAAPSAMNRQPWRFIVVNNKATIDHIDAVGMAALQKSDPTAFERMQGRGGTLLYHAPAMILVTSAALDSDFSADLDIGIATSHIALAATSLGLQTCIVGFARMPFQADPTLAAQVGVPDGFTVDLAVLIGHAAGQPTAPHAADPSKVIWSR
jgi:nitroreductase